MSDQAPHSPALPKRPADAPQAFYLLAKPTGAICNLDCAYCFFLEKEQLYPGSRFRMDDDLLQNYVRQTIESQAVSEATIAWQGGEPTLMGLDFFRRSIAYERQFCPPGMAIRNTIQTNGTLIDDEWAAFFKEHDFLVGISIDGPSELHNQYRLDKGGAPTFDKVMRGLGYLQKHGVDYNALVTLNHANAGHPLDVYRFLRDEAKAQFIQFIPIVERLNKAGVPFGDQVTDRSIGAAQYGEFLIAVFEEWVRRDIGEIYVQMFDVALANWYGDPAGLCVFSPTCGAALAMEHNGDLYACDHFVEPAYLLGNIRHTHMLELVASAQQRAFGVAKRDALPQYCRDCSVRFACHGACPKDRFITAPGGEPGLNYLCAGYKAFFSHIDGPMRTMCQLLRQNRAPSEIRFAYADQDRRLAEAFRRAGRNDPCPCGSGKKFKRCHGATS
jgi:uncharacterized protein